MPLPCYTLAVHDDLEQRKSQHLDLVQRDEVEPESADPLFDRVHLIHRALPELSLDEVDLSTDLCGRALKAPLIITGMTGGTERAGQINRDLAALAQETGVAFGVGSMRILLDQPDLLPTFAVQSRPPLLLANLGAQQLVQRGTDAALRLIDLIEADGIAIHLNAAQELVQEAGDRDFRGQVEAISKLVPRANVIVKETGCGLSPAVVGELWDAGVRAVDVSGAGGTSWPRVEQLRAKTSASRGLGELLSDWGIPTAASIAGARAASPQMQIVGSGGIRSGFDAAKAIALGADVAGFALPMVRAHQQGGVATAREALRACIAALRAAFLLCGARNAVALRASRPIVLEPLKTWIEGLAE